MRDLPPKVATSLRMWSGPLRLIEPMQLVSVKALSSNHFEKEFTMFVVNNRQISFAHITMIEWVDASVTAVDPVTAQIVKMYGFNIHTSYGQTEQLLYGEEEKRHEEWEALINAMEASGY